MPESRTISTQPAISINIIEQYLICKAKFYENMVSEKNKSNGHLN